MLIKFTGKYTNGRTSITYGGVTFEGYEPTECPDELAAKLIRGEFERAEPLDQDGDGKKGGSRSPKGDLKALRAEYFQKFGKRPFNGWDAAELKTRIEA